MKEVCCLCKNQNGEIFNVIKGEVCPNYVGCMHNKYCGAKQPRTRKEEFIKIQGHNKSFVDKKTNKMLDAMDITRWKSHVKVK